MVSEKAGAAALVANFAEKGLGVQQLVALSGAHTIGEHGGVIIVNHILCHMLVALLNIVAASTCLVLVLAKWLICKEMRSC
jgi:hypothetical protein